MRKSMLIVIAFCLPFGAGLACAESSEVVTGGHVLSAMMTPDATTCTVSVAGSLDPVFKGADTTVDLVCQSAASPTSLQVVATTRQCSDAIDGCVSSVDECTGKFAMTLPGDTSSGSCVLPQAPPGEVCYFVAHVTSTNRQQCNGATNTNGSDPSGTAPCSGGYCSSVH
jgi:hypothetical protein